MKRSRVIARPLSKKTEARATLYRLLGVAFQYPADLDWKLFSNSFQSLLAEAAGELDLDFSGELEALDRIWPHELDDRFLHEHTELFINSSHGVIFPLNESVYFGHDRLVNTERTLAVRNAYLKAGLDPTKHTDHLLPDHLSLELEFMALCLLKGYDIEAFFNTHIYSWQPSLMGKITASEYSGFYIQMANILGRFLEAEYLATNGAIGKT
ncbi:MAG: molecular chaperone TorD family protein [Pseudomonadota bacterium]